MARYRIRQVEPNLFAIEERWMWHWWAITATASEMMARNTVENITETHRLRKEPKIIAEYDYRGREVRDLC